MYDIEKLNNKKVAELREIAEKLSIQKVDKLKKQELVYKILDEQAMNPKKEEAKPKSTEPRPSRNNDRTRSKRENGSSSNEKRGEKSPQNNHRQKRTQFFPTVLEICVQERR